MRVTADTNIYLSAILFGGPPEEVVNLARRGEIQLLVSPIILLEMTRILKSKFNWRDTDVSEAVQSIGYCAELFKPSLTIAELADDADNRILECAVEGRANFIVSGDHHLLELQSFRGIRILRARELLDLITER